DVGGGGGGVIGRVIGCIGAAKGDTADTDRVGGADVLVGETGAGVGSGEAVTGQAVIRENHRGAGAAIIDLVDPGGRDAQGTGADIGGSSGGGVKGVIAGVSSREVDAGDVDGLVGADGFGDKAGAGITGGEAIAANPIIR